MLKPDIVILDGTVISICTSEKGSMVGLSDTEGAPVGVIGVPVGANDFDGSELGKGVLTVGIELVEGKDDGVAEGDADGGSTS